MWSLLKKKQGEESAIFDYSGEKLEPLKFSNGKTQEDVVKEVLDAIKDGNKIIFIKGVCGSGKSAVALNIARHFSKTSIVVPIKSLQNQYEDDYTNKKFILKKDNKKMKIAVIKGRNNFQCLFSNKNADNPELPCTIEIRESNMEKISCYLEMNPDVSGNLLIKDIRRMSIAPVCPYYSPVLPAKVSLKPLENAVKKNYPALAGEYALFQRKLGCKYYNQYQSYIDADVIIFNSQKYLIETLIGRKPKTDIEIIDECDEFLDNFAEERKINLNRLFSAVNNIKSKEKKPEIQALLFEINELIYNFSLGEIDKLKNTRILNLIEKILENPDLADDEESYYSKVYESALEFADFLDETYVLFEKEQKEGRINAYISLVTINLAKKFKDLKDKNKILIMMSGTIHSEEVLRDIFGIQDFKIIEAETIMPGTITKFRTGMEKNCKYENFKQGIVTRKQYLSALSSCVEKAKKPLLVHVNSFEDLPNELEKAEYKLDNLITRERLKEMQEQGNQIDKFKSKEIDVLFTTKCSRGIDFPGEICNSIILTKYPYPNINSIFWKILRKEKPDKFSGFYLDKARRELLQKIYRGLRFKEDHILLLSPDVRVLEANI